MVALSLIRARCRSLPRGSACVRCFLSSVDMYVHYVSCVAVAYSKSFLWNEGAEAWGGFSVYAGGGSKVYGGGFRTCLKSGPLGPPKVDPAPR